MTTEKKPALVKVVILNGQQHRHQGRDYKEGAELKLSNGQAQWLVGEKKVRII